MSASRSALGVATVVLIGLATQIARPSVARADTADREIKRAIDDYDNLDYDKAEARLTRLLHQKARLSQPQLLQAYTYLAYSQALLGENDRAMDSFGQLLDLAPSTELPPTISPKIQTIFSQVKQARSPHDIGAPVDTGTPSSTQSPEGVASPVVIGHSIEPDLPRAGETVAVRASLSDPAGRVASVELRYRSRGADRFSTVVSSRRPGTDLVTLELPGPFVQAPAVELYLVAKDANGNAVAEDGSPDLPISLPVEDQARPLLASPWLWGGAAIGAAALVAGGWFLFGRSAAPTAPAVVTIQPQ